VYDSGDEENIVVAENDDSKIENSEDSQNDVECNSKGGTGGTAAEGSSMQEDKEEQTTI